VTATLPLAEGADGQERPGRAGGLDAALAEALGRGPTPRSHPQHLARPLGRPWVAEARPAVLGPSAVHPAKQASGSPARAGSTRRTEARLAGFEANPYLLSRVPASAGAPPVPPKSRRPGIRWGTVVLVLVLAAAGYVVDRLAHPSPHRSPTAVALAFYQDLASGNVRALEQLVEPSQAGAVPSAMTAPVVEAFRRTSLRGVVVQPGTTEPGSLLTLVVLQTCQANLSCEPTVPVPTTKVGDAWDVDWVAWQASLSPAAG
jgi:hypothetical protein